MAFIQFGTVASALALSAAVALLGITVTHSDPWTAASRAPECRSSAAAAQNVYCWVGKPATITDTATIPVSDDERGGQTGWISLDIAPSVAIPFAEADWPAFNPHKGDKVVAQMVRGKMLSVSSARGRFFVMNATPASYPLVPVALVILAVGLIGAAVMRDECRGGPFLWCAWAADLVLLPLTVVAVIAFCFHESTTTAWGILLTGGMTGACSLVDAAWWY